MSSFMKFYADLHIHSKYSRATSKDLNFEALYLWAQLKGVQVVGTGDFLHPGWFKEIQTKLEPAEEGFFKLKKEFAKKVDPQVSASCRGEVRFILSVEISNIYKRLEQVRKVHNLVFAPRFEVA
ncbi:MAG: DNA helicase, partial [Candidatus Omnitrophica bacterium]|nr:DNA helicase [Candidatus Omnitrophota bacterium]